MNKKVVKIIEKVEDEVILYVVLGCVGVNVTRLTGWISAKMFKH